MKRLSVMNGKRCFVAGLLALTGVLALSPSAFAQNCPSNCKSPHSIGVYVNDGRGHRNGHVWVGMNHGNQTQHVGFYPNSRGAGALVGRNGGQVKDDSNTTWHIRGLYPLTPEQYRQAMDEVNNWRNRTWSAGNHCGDFAESVGRAGGVPLNLGWGPSGRNRPGVFADYLRQNGGTVNPNLLRP